MENVQSRPRLLTSQNNQSNSCYDDEDEYGSYYGTEATNQESINRSTEVQSLDHIKNQKPIHLRYNDVLAKKNFKLEQLREQ